MVFVWQAVTSIISHTTCTFRLWRQQLGLNFQSIHDIVLFQTRWLEVLWCDGVSLSLEWLWGMKWWSLSWLRTRNNNLLGFSRVVCVCRANSKTKLKQRITRQSRQTRNQTQCRVKSNWDWDWTGKRFRRRRERREKARQPGLKEASLPLEEPRERERFRLLVVKECLKRASSE